MDQYDQTPTKVKPVSGSLNDMFVESAIRTIETEANGLIELASKLRGDLSSNFALAVSAIARARGRIIISGMGKSGHVGRKIAATFASTGTPSFFVHPGEASHGDLGMVTSEDVVVAISWSGETSELRDIVQYTRRFNVPLIAITSRLDSSLGREADIPLILPRSAEACPHNLAPTTSTTMQIAIGDALAVALLESRSFTPKDFRRFHPGGKLGAVLTFVREAMHSGSSVPIVSLSTLMSEALIIMSAKSFGCVGVTDSMGVLVGVVTDGDLRRHMCLGLTSMRADEVMSHAPSVVGPDDLAAFALSEIQKKAVTALFVVDGGKPVGIVHIHDLIKLGIV